MAPGCLYGDRYPRFCDGIIPRDCYNSNTQYECCDTCDGYATGPPDCRYGDLISGCLATSCNTYSAQNRLDCCATCLPPPTRAPPPPTTGPPFPTTDTFTTPGTTSTSDTQRSSGTPDWAVPVGAAVGGLLLVVILVGVFIYCRRRNRGPKHLTPTDERMYNEYKISKRAPVAPPRPDEPSLKAPKEGGNTYNYAYVEPNGIPSNRLSSVDSGQSSSMDSGQSSKRKGDDPLPPTPGTYIEADKYGYFQPVADESLPSNSHVPYNSLPSNSHVPYNSHVTNSVKTNQPNQLSSTYTELVQPAGGKEHVYNSRISDKMKF